MSKWFRAVFAMEQAVSAGNPTPAPRGAGTKMAMRGSVMSPVVVQSMAGRDTADVDGTVRGGGAGRRGSGIVRITVDRDEAAAAVPKIKERLLKMGCEVPIVGDFHYIGHKLEADVMEVADDGDLAADLEQPLLDLRHSGGGLVAVDGDANNSEPARASAATWRRCSDVGGVGVGHRLHDHGGIAADRHTADPGPAPTRRRGWIPAGNRLFHGRDIAH